MAFRFVSLCDLFEDLEQHRDSKFAAGAKQDNPDGKIIKAWFNQHNAKIPRTGQSAIAFLSCLFPERRVDRVYDLKEKRLTKALSRSLALGLKRKRQFEESVRNGEDLGHCVERVLRQAEFPTPDPRHEVTLAEIDKALDHLAASSRFSSRDLRSRTIGRRFDEVLEPIYHRLQGREAKWLTRIILNDFSTIVIPERVTMNHYHFLLYDLLHFQASFAAATNTLEQPEVSKLAPHQQHDNIAELKQEFAHFFVPQINTFVRRQPYSKARSIKHCCALTRGRPMSVERKYDGEYCQIHVDLSQPTAFTIFSKSGKDSTSDKVRIHDSLKQALCIGLAGSKIRSRCILEGELVVWNDLSKSIRPFRTIRKHVQRSGRFIGTEDDSPPHPDDRLMIVLYDILLLDDVICMKHPHTKRQKLLKAVCQRIYGRVDFVDRRRVNFGSRQAPDRLRQLFAESITAGWEGLILKGLDDPYGVLPSSQHGIKLKKDYIKGLGDTLDFVIIGGRHNLREEVELERGGIRTNLAQAGLSKLLWTTFYIGCLENKTEVRRWEARPRFRTVGTVGNGCIAKDDIVRLNQLGQFCQVPMTSMTAFDVTSDQPQLSAMVAAFSDPFVVEIMGAGFDRPSGVNYPMLRFPRLQKIHEDRSISDTVGLDELREEARAAETIFLDHDSQEDAMWIERLIKADGRPKYCLEQSQATTCGASMTATSPASTSTPRSNNMIRIDTPELTPSERMKVYFEPKSASPMNPRRKRQAPKEGSPPSYPSKRIRITSSLLSRSPENRTAEVLTLTPVRGNGEPLADISNIAHLRPWRSPRFVQDQMVTSKGKTMPQTSPALARCEVLKAIVCKDHHTRAGHNVAKQLDVSSTLSPNPMTSPKPSLQQADSSMTQTDFGGQTVASRSSRAMTDKPEQVVPSVEAANHLNNVFFLPTPPSPPHQQQGFFPRAAQIAGERLFNEDNEAVAATPRNEALPHVHDRGSFHSFVVSSFDNRLIYLSFPKSSPTILAPAYMLLSQTKMSFTFSLDHFLGSCCKPEKEFSHWTSDPMDLPKIALFDSTSMTPGCIAEQIIAVGKGVKSRLTTGSSRKPDTSRFPQRAILFFDWSILRLLDLTDADIKDEIARSLINRHFCGALLYSGTSNGVKACWDLPEALSLNFP